MGRRKLGRLPEPMRIQARHMPVARSIWAMETLFDRARRVDARLKSLAAVKASTVAGCFW